MTYKISNQKIPADFHDSFVQDLPEYSFMMSYAWMEFMHNLRPKSFRLEYIYKDGQLVGILPYSLIKAKRGPLMELRHSPIIDWKDMDLALFVLDYLIQQAKRNGLWLVRFQPYVEEETWESIRKELNKKLAHRLLISTLHERDFERTAVLDLHPSYSQLYSSFRKTHRKYIRRAKRMGLEVKVYEEYNQDAHETLLKLFMDTAKRKGWVERSTDYYRLQYKILAKHNIARIFIVYKGNTPLYGSMHEFYGGRVLAHYAGANWEYRDLPAAYLLKDFVIQYAKENGYLYYDLGGISQPNAKKHPLAGVTAFKLGLRAVPKKYAYTNDIVLASFGYLTRTYEILNNIKRGWYSVKDVLRVVRF